ncbi:hypothetical protein QAD02_011131 [Eretmocerus hayati]|uniref:Uncharacterized protein n=1 Tax=Eretmocerus hayati TaxID=131215 RepID=A0ACC2P0N2_9HYME|nr:hypothetical protein QAD02_011131 [Eretmocerus hayati]
MFLARVPSHNFIQRALFNEISHAEEYIKQASLLVKVIVTDVDSSAESIKYDFEGINSIYEARKGIVSKTLVNIHKNIQDSQNLTMKVIDVLEKQVLKSIFHLIVAIITTRDSISAREEDLINEQKNVIAKASPVLQVSVIAIGGDRGRWEQAQKSKKHHELELEDLFRTTKTLIDYLLTMNGKCREIISDCENHLEHLELADGHVGGSKTFFDRYIHMIENRGIFYNHTTESSDSSVVYLDILENLKSKFSQVYPDA